MRWLHSATAEASSLGLGHFNFVTVQRRDTMGSQAALTEFTELHRAGCNSSFTSFRSELSLCFTELQWDTLCIYTKLCHAPSCSLYFLCSL